MNSCFRVLYAEDNALDADLTRAHFSEHAPEFDIEIVETGQACLDQLSLTGCDLLLLDHRLPDMGGLDVLRTLVHTGVPTPVVLVTGSGDEDLVVKALHLGAANYVPKVGNYLESLPDLLRSVIEEHHLRVSQGLLPAGPRRILYVEHHEMDIDLTLRHFAEAAPQVELNVIRTCADALTRLGRPPAYDAVLIDLRMPDQSGLDFVREAKRLGLALPPFIMISGKGDEGAAIASLTLGAADYVAKREGYLDQLPYTIDRAIAYDRLNRVNLQLRTELAERERAQLALEEKQLFLNTLLEAMPLPVFYKDAKGGYLGFNQAFERYYGKTREELVGKSVFDIAPRELAEIYHAKDDELLRAPGVQVYESKTKDAGGQLHDVVYHKATFVDSNGQVSGLVGAILDITQRKRAEEEREKLEEQLRASQKMEAIGSLAGGVAHDFNNLLCVILSYTGFALEGVQEGDPLIDNLLEVEKAAHRAAALTRQLLAFSRKQVLQPVPLNLNQIAADVEKMLRRILGEDIDFVQALAPDLGLTLADPGQIEQVLMNLVVNARDSMPEGGKLTIETANVDLDEEYATRHVAVKPGAYIQLAVTDTGCGMDRQTQTRMFDPFFTTKEKGKGTGLGLSTVYGIVKQSGGDIWVYSEPGKGTTFKICLPRELSVTTATTVEPPPVSKRVTGTETVLVVEDEDALRKAAMRGLSAAGYTVLAAANGKDALLTCARHEGDVHLLVTDVVMPKMSGRTLAQELSRRRPSLKVLYMSGYTDDAIVHHGVLDAGTHFLAKPFTSIDLTRKVREVLDGCIGNLVDSQRRAFEANVVREEQPLGAEGTAEGEAKGEATAVLAVLEGRGILVTENQRWRILECSDLDRLGKWVRKAVTLTDVDELFEQ